MDTTEDAPSTDIDFGNTKNHSALWAFSCDNKQSIIKLCNLIDAKQADWRIYKVASIRYRITTQTSPSKDQLPFDRLTGSIRFTQRERAAAFNTKLLWKIPYLRCRMKAEEEDAYKEIAQLAPSLCAAVYGEAEEESGLTTTSIDAAHPQLEEARLPQASRALLQDDRARALTATFVEATSESECMLAEVQFLARHPREHPAVPVCRHTADLILALREQNRRHLEAAQMTLKPWQVFIANLLEDKETKRGETVHLLVGRRGGQGKSRLVAWLQDIDCNTVEIAPELTKLQAERQMSKQQFDKQIVAINFERDNKPHKQTYTTFEALTSGAYRRPENDPKAGPHRYKQPPHLLVISNNFDMWQYQRLTLHRWNVYHLETANPDVEPTLTLYKCRRRKAALTDQEYDALRDDYNMAVDNGDHQMREFVTANEESGRRPDTPQPITFVWDSERLQLNKGPTGKQREARQKLNLKEED